MFEAAQVIGLYAETPLHPGTGATRGAIDLPVQRERHTGFPLIPASSLKGVLRDAAEAANRRSGQPTLDQVDEVFGPKAGDLHGGALAPTDARILLFPVRSLQGIFVWMTCPFVLTRLARDLSLAKQNASIPDFQVNDGKARVSRQSGLENPLVLEDEEYSLDPPSKNPEVDTLATTLQAFFPGTAAYQQFRNRLAKYLVVLSDTDFRRLVDSGTGTDVVTRIKLNEQKTTTGGGGNMWVEEFLPSDCLFYSLLLAMPSRRKPSTLNSGTDVLNALRDNVMLKEKDKQVMTLVLQIGGDETVGRGWMRLEWLNGIPV